MIVAVERELRKIADYLTEMGYQVVEAESFSGAVDAYVYENAGFSANTQGGGLSSSVVGENGILMVNAKNKTPNEILNILVSRVYGDILNFL